MRSRLMIPAPTRGHGQRHGRYSGCPKSSLRIIARTTGREPEGKTMTLRWITALVVLLTVAATGQISNAQNNPARPAAPPPAAPRWPDGHINLGPIPGEMGLWEVGPTAVPLTRPDAAGDLGLFAADTREPTDPFLAAKPRPSQV